MSLQLPPRLLEINIISAQDLPPVSKLLRTFAVAYLNPDHKLTTRIDHRGHTNPTWNYKVAFHVDDRFLNNESAAITFEIYNLAWLRDLPIGTARLFVGNLSPPLHKNPAYRSISLQICRPSGHLRGTLNLGIQIVDKAIPGREICPLQNQSERGNEEGKIQDADKGSEGQDQAKNPGSRTMTPRKGSLCPTPESKASIRPENEPESRTSIATSCGSNFMRPLPSEVAEDLKMGYGSAAWNEYRSSIFEGWTEAGDRENDDDIHLTRDKEHGKSMGRKKKAGLFSCFGNAYGFQYGIFCGSKATRKKDKKERNVHKQNVHLMTNPEKNLRGFYV